MLSPSTSHPPPFATRSFRLFARLPQDVHTKICVFEELPGLDSLTASVASKLKAGGAANTYQLLLDNRAVVEHVSELRDGDTVVLQEVVTSTTGTTTGTKNDGPTIKKEPGESAAAVKIKEEPRDESQSAAVGTANNSSSTPLVESTIKKENGQQEPPEQVKRKEQLSKEEKIKEGAKSGCTNSSARPKDRKAALVLPKSLTDSTWDDDLESDKKKVKAPPEDGESVASNDSTKTIAKSAVQAAVAEALKHFAMDDEDGDSDDDSDDSDDEIEVLDVVPAQTPKPKEVVMVDSPTPEKKAKETDKLNMEASIENELVHNKEPSCPLKRRRSKRLATESETSKKAKADDDKEKNATAPTLPPKSKPKQRKPLQKVLSSTNHLGKDHDRQNSEESTKAAAAEEESKPSEPKRRRMQCDTSGLRTTTATNGQSSEEPQAVATTPKHRRKRVTMHKDVNAPSEDDASESTNSSSSSHKQTCATLQAAATTADPTYQIGDRYFVPYYDGHYYPVHVVGIKSATERRVQFENSSLTKDAPIESLLPVTPEREMTWNYGKASSSASSVCSQSSRETRSSKSQDYLKYGAVTNSAKVSGLNKKLKKENGIKDLQGRWVAQRNRIVYFCIEDETPRIIKAKFPRLSIGKLLYDNRALWGDALQKQSKMRPETPFVLPRTWNGHMVVATGNNVNPYMIKWNNRQGGNSIVCGEPEPQEPPIGN